MDNITWLRWGNKTDKLKRSIESPSKLTLVYNATDALETNFH